MLFVYNCKYDTTVVVRCCDRRPSAGHVRTQHQRSAQRPGTPHAEQRLGKDVGHVDVSQLLHNVPSRCYRYAPGNGWFCAVHRAEVTPLPGAVGSSTNARPAHKHKHKATTRRKAPTGPITIFAKKTAQATPPVPFLAALA